MNTDVLEQEVQPTPYPNQPNTYQPSPYGEAVPVPGTQSYGSPYSNQPTQPQVNPYEVNPYMDYGRNVPSYNNGYSSYDPYYPPMNKKDTGDSVMAEFLFSIAIVLIMIIVSYLIYRLKLFLKRMEMLTPLMARFLDAFETIFTKTANKVANKKIGKAFGAKVNDKGNDTVNLVREHLAEGLKEEFVVEPNKKEDKKIQPKVQESKQQPTEEVEHLPSLDELENEINGKVK